MDINLGGTATDSDQQDADDDGSGPASSDTASGGSPAAGTGGRSGSGDPIGGVLDTAGGLLGGESPGGDAPSSDGGSGNPADFAPADDGGSGGGTAPVDDGGSGSPTASPAIGSPEPTSNSDGGSPPLGDGTGGVIGGEPPAAGGGGGGGGGSTSVPPDSTPAPQGINDATNTPTGDSGDVAPPASDTASKPSGSSGSDSSDSGRGDSTPSGAPAADASGSSGGAAPSGIPAPAPDMPSPSGAAQQPVAGAGTQSNAASRGPPPPSTAASRAAPASPPPDGDESPQQAAPAPIPQQSRTAAPTNQAVLRPTIRPSRSPEAQLDEAAASAGGPSPPRRSQTTAPPAAAVGGAPRPPQARPTADAGTEQPSQGGESQRPGAPPATGQALPTATIVLGTAYTLLGGDLLPWQRKSSRSFEAAFQQLLRSDLDLGAADLTYRGSLRVGNGTATRRLRRRLLQQGGGADGAQVFYDISGIPAAEQEDISDSLGDDDTLQRFLQLLQDRGLAVSSIQLVRVQPGGISVPDAVIVADESGGGRSRGAAIGGAVAGTAAGLFLLLCVWAVCRSRRRRRHARMSDSTLLLGDKSDISRSDTADTAHSGGSTAAKRSGDAGVVTSQPYMLPPRQQQEAVPPPPPAFPPASCPEFAAPLDSSGMPQQPMSPTRAPAPRQRISEWLDARAQTQGGLQIHETGETSLTQAPPAFDPYAASIRESRNRRN